MEENNQLAQVEIVNCPFCGMPVPKKGEVVETKQTITPRLGITVNVEFKMTICKAGHKFIKMEDLEKTLKGVNTLEGKILSNEI